MAAHDDDMQELGAFEVDELNRLLAKLEAARIRFELAGDEPVFGEAPLRGFANPADATKLTVLVPAASVAEARAIVARLYPT